jgi:hypothetical protein
MTGLQLMKRWLQDRMHVYGAKKAREDLERALSILRGQDDKEVSQTLFTTFFIKRIICEQELGWPMDELFYEKNPEPTEQRSLFLLSFLKLIKQLQKNGDLAAAAGAMIWLHSIRAVVYPEVRGQAKELWSELFRGYNYVEDRLYETFGDDYVIQYGNDRLMAEIRGMTPPNLRKFNRWR